MNYKLIGIIIVLAVLWESFLAHTGIFAFLDFFAALSTVLLIEKVDLKFIVLWSVLIGLTMDLIRIAPLGLAGFSILGAILVLVGLNSMFSFIKQETRLFNIVIFLIGVRMISDIGLLLMDRLESLNVLNILVYVIVNTVLALIMFSLYGKQSSRSAIKV